MSRFNIFYKEVLLRATTGKAVKFSEEKDTIVEADSVDTAITKLREQVGDIKLIKAIDLDYVPELSEYEEKEKVTDEK